MSRVVGSRRSAGGRTRDLTAVLALALPIATVGLVLLTGTATPTVELRPPTLSDLTTASIVCPGAASAPSSAYLTTGSDRSGTVMVRDGGDGVATVLTPDRVTTVNDRAGLVVTGDGALASGLVGARFSDSGRALAACVAPAPELWFTAVGAGAQHASVLELVNPDPGRAVVDVTVYGDSPGAVDVPALRGVSVPGHSTTRLELDVVLPRSDELALHLVISRGRLGAFVRDGYDRIGSDPGTQEWLPAQSEPATANLLVGLPPGRGQQTLVVANPGSDEVRATIKVIGEESVFTPAGVAELRIAPESTEPLPIDGPLRQALRDGGLGLEITSSAPVTATLRSLVDGDLSHAVPGETLSAETIVLVPPGKKEVVLAGSTSVGVVTVVARSASGEELASTRAELRPEQGAVVSVPRRAVLVSVLPENTTVTGSVVVSGKGSVVAQLTGLVRTGLVPDVRPGLP